MTTTDIDHDTPGARSFTDVMTFAPPEDTTPTGAALLGFVFAKVWERPGLSRRDRRFVTLPCVAAADAEGPLRECLEVMEVQGFKVVDLPGTPVRALAFATKVPLWLSKPILSRAAGAGRGAKMPSFYLDLHSGRGKSEVQYLHGEVVRAGERCNVPTPVNKVLTETLLALMKKEIPLEEFPRKPEKLLAKIKSAQATWSSHKKE